MPAGQGPTLRLRVPPEPTFAKYVRERVVDFAAAHGVGDDDLTDFLIAVGEALANAVEHSRTDDSIEVACWLVGDEQLIATVVDSGIGFEVEKLLAATAELPVPLADRGRGVALMRRCSDIFSVRSAPGRGTAVVLGRQLRRGGSAPPSLQAG